MCLYLSSVGKVFFFCLDPVNVSFLGFVGSGWTSVYPWGGALTLAIRERGLPGVVTKEPQRWFIAINYSKNWRNPLPSPMASDSRTNSTSENSVVSYHPLNPHLFLDCTCWIPLV